MALVPAALVLVALVLVAPVVVEGEVLARAPVSGLQAFSAFEFFFQRPQ